MPKATTFMPEEGGNGIMDEWNDKRKQIKIRLTNNPIIKILKDRKDYPESYFTLFTFFQI